MFKPLRQPGYVTIISIVIIGAIATAVAVSLLGTGINLTKNSATDTNLAQAGVLTDACLEEALQAIRDSDFTGTLNLSFSTGTCSTTVISTGATNFTIQSEGLSGRALKKAEVIVSQTSPSLVLDSWKEVSEFGPVIPVIPSPAIAIVASASNPADNGSAAGPTVAITPPGGLEVGDVIVMSTMYRGTATINIGNAGGQSWTVLSQQANGSISAKLFYSVFNGTWTANPSVTVGTGSLGLTAVMHAFRNVDPTVIDVTPVAANFSSPGAPNRDVTIPGISTASNGALVMAVWATPDDNTWGLQTAGWANIGSAQYRNLTGSDSSLSTAYLLLPAAGPSGDVVNRQVSRGGDAGVSFIMSLKQKP